MLLILMIWIKRIGLNLNRKITIGKMGFAWASDLGIGVSSVSEIEIISADQESMAFRTEEAHALLSG